MRLSIAFLSAAALFAQPAVEFRPAGTMITTAGEREAMLLTDGRVLVTGGTVCPPTGACVPQADAELYDPAARTWSAAAPMSIGRYGHQLVRLASGRVMSIGGRIPTGWTQRTEFFEPATGAWTAGPPMRQPRYFHRALRLPGGKILVTGGLSMLVDRRAEPTNTAEIYDPVTNTWTLAAPMPSPRQDHTMTLLADGRVLVASGFADNGTAIRTPVELDVYDPAANSWTTAAHLTAKRAAASAILLADGRVLISGGVDEAEVALKSTEIFHPDGRVTAGADLPEPRFRHTSTLLPGGQVLLTGGFYSYDETTPPLSTADFYDSASNTFTAAPAMATRRAFQNAIVLRTGQVLIAGGGGRSPAPAELLASKAPGEGEIVIVPAASYADLTTLAPDSLAACFGANLAASTQTASALPWPTVLGGVSVTVRDSRSVSRDAQLLLASAGQINFLVPRDTAEGRATITLRQGDRTVATGSAVISGVAPALFSADGSGQGLPAANVVRAGAGGALVTESVARYDAAQQRFVAVPVATSAPGQPAVLVLYGSGLRGRTALSAVRVTIGGQPAAVQFASASPEFPGVDQLNVQLPEALTGVGLVEIAVSVDGREANVLIMQMR